MICFRRSFLRKEVESNPEDIMNKIPRADRSRERMKETLLSLLRVRPLYEISVSELCREAGVGRTTFYRYYGNISQILGELLDDILSQVPSVTAHLTDAPKDPGCPYPICEFVRRDPRVFALFCNDSAGSFIIDRIIAAFKSEYVDTMRRHSALSEQQLTLLLRFQVSGCLALIRKSAGDSDESWRTSREAVDQFLRRGLTIHSG